jgi:hypothetical protein
MHAGSTRAARAFAPAAHRARACGRAEQAPSTSATRSRWSTPSSQRTIAV